MLPIYNREVEILNTLKKHRVVVVIGEPGSGKTTQIPQILLKEYEDARVAVTQPRRVASVTVASRVAKEMKTRVGEKVGYKIRFENRTRRSQTKIVFLTDGVLLRECLEGDLSSKYRFVILDEAHERSIHTDILIGLLKREVRMTSSTFRVIISSATLDSEKFSKFFDDAPIVRVSGRTYPVDVIHTRKSIRTRASVMDAAIDTVLRIHEENEYDGHVLLFLSGQGEIERACSMLRQRRQDGNLIVLPLYGALRSEKQQEAFRDVARNVRKVVVCTNIAETSVTIPGIRFVVDAGYV